MSTLQIRDLPADIREALAFRAKRDHRSLAQQAIVELRQMPEIRAANERLDVLAAIKQELSGNELPLAPEVLIREDRER